MPIECRTDRNSTNKGRVLTRIERKKQCRTRAAPPPPPPRERTGPSAESVARESRRCPWAAQSRGSGAATAPPSPPAHTATLASAALAPRAALMVTLRGASQAARRPSLRHCPARAPEEPRTERRSRDRLPAARGHTGRTRNGCLYRTRPATSPAPIRGSREYGKTRS